jgi:hypothetical protein
MQRAAFGESRIGGDIYRNEDKRNNKPFHLSLR